MSQTVINNQDQQINEVMILSNIYNYNEFSSYKTDIIECYYNVFPAVNDNLLRLENVYKPVNNNTFSEDCIKYLPPVRVYLQLPTDYPDKKSPNFYVSASWLSPWQISFICQKLDEIWTDNKGQEILFLWFEFLRNNLLNFLQIKDALDISFMYMAHNSITDYFKLNLTLQNDTRAIYNPSFSNPMQFLINYDKYQQKIEFENNYHVCTICFDYHCGKQCIKLRQCNHIYCKQCIQEYVAIKINENDVNNIVCADLNCNLNITFNEVKELCPELFLKYETFLLQMTIKTMQNVILCPRKLCQCPVIKNGDDPLAVCSECDYPFCIYCYKLYHGVTPCIMTNIASIQLIEEYQNGNKEKKRLLEKEYGRKQLQIVVEEYLSKQYLKEHAKPCPNCCTVVSKISGCNKMTCIYCKVHFCWICGIQITTKNAYDHFLFVDKPCYKRLFEEIGE
ncbi:E3 ubiquitin-protein ligase RNF14 [Anthophora quadrimaculata]